MRDAEKLRNLAANFRKLAEEADAQSAESLRDLADEYEELARKQDPYEGPAIPMPE